MTYEEYYGDHLPLLETSKQKILDVIEQYPKKDTLGGIQQILYCQSRIKKPESMVRKLKSKDLPTDSATALSKMHDAVGVRVVCSFIDDVYDVYEWLCTRDEYSVVQVKDYIAYPKPNGYRSLHLILQLGGDPYPGLMAEIQLRTIAIDSWAALEHQLKYKRTIEHEKTICGELKSCADEIASLDMSMQTLRDILYSES